MTRTPTSNPWVRRFKPLSDSRARLVCFPHAGGSASYFLRLARRLVPAVETLSVQYPGRQERRREPFCTSISELADGIFEALLPQLVEPYAFFGHSMGSILAFEVARRFERSAGSAPVRIFASARPAPSTRGRGDVHLLDDATLLGEMKRLGGTDPRVLEDGDLLSVILPVVRADYQAIGTYACPAGASVRCPVTAMIGDSDPVATADEALVWREHTTGGFDLAAYPGGHFYIDENIDRVAGDITAVLAGAGKDGPGAGDASASR
ncbi:alpha/beta fold hydrolase [Saccharopolyspora shandongensis]|uniref:thioesterase II family protein n=1 Tax=Saccharopolyspora shandongensis TaxID=418495 RepID=UPI00342A51A2